jgi:molybdopterin molybdotransferase
MKPDLLSVDAALAHLLAGARSVMEVEEVDTFDSVGRVLAENLVSALDVPAMDTSMMDGYAVRSGDFAAGGEVKLEVTQRIPAGQVGAPLGPGTAARIFTGARIPEHADAVVMQEACEAAGNSVLIHQPPKAGDWITPLGADIRKGARILQVGMRIRPQDAGLAATIGNARVRVFRRLRVALFSTGDELVMPGEPLPPGAIYNSNRYVLHGLLVKLGCEVRDLGIVPDRLDATRAALRNAAAGCDLILTSGGVSVGEEDHIRPALEAEGALSLWRIAMKPGRPLSFGHVGKAGGGGHVAAFIGLPGNPVSSFVTFLVFVRPFILKCQGASQNDTHAYTLRADFDWPKPDARREFLRVKLNGEGGLDLFPNQASAVLTSTVWSDGLVDNPERHVIRQGDLVRYLPFSALLN